MLKQYLTDIRDYAYLLEKKQNGFTFGKVRYKYKLLFTFVVYHFLIFGNLTYFIRANYHVPRFLTHNTSILFNSMMSIIVIIIPFELFYYVMNKYIIKTQVPVDGVDEKTYKRKKRVFWTSLVLGIVMLVITVYITTLIGYVGNGPIF